MFINHIQTFRTTLRILIIPFILILLSAAGTSLIAAEPVSTASLQQDHTYFYNLPLVSYSFVPEPPGCNATHGSGGLTPGAYKVKVAGLDTVIVVGAGYDPNTTTLLGFQLHGDSGNVDKFLSPGNQVTKFVNKQSWIFIAPEAPNGGFSWWKDQNGDHVQAFADVLDSIFAQYNVCRHIVFGSSGSGGSEFWTAHFFPDKGGDYPAHTVVSCGGNDGTSSDRQRVHDLGRDPVVVSRSTFYYVYGTNDYLYDLIMQSIDLYTSAGFPIRIHRLEGAGHCNKWEKEGLPSQSEQIALKWAELAQERGIVLK